METKGMEQIYQQIANTLVDIIPEKWNKIYLYAEFREGYRKVFFYYYPNSGEKPVYSLDIIEFLNVNEDEFDELENELYRYLANLHKEFKIQEQEQWTNLTFILDNTGQMDKKIQYPDSCERNQLESKFGTLKTFHGLERLCSRLKETSELEVELAILGLNLCQRVLTSSVVFFNVLFWTLKIQIKAPKNGLTIR